MLLIVTGTQLSTQVNCTGRMQFLERDVWCLARTSHASTVPLKFDCHGWTVPLYCVAPREILTMSSVSRVINRGETFDEGSIPNKWRWEWMEKSVKVGNCDQRLSSCFRKIDTPGFVRCIVCKPQKEFSYANRGITALIQHAESKKHVDASSASDSKVKQTALPGKLLQFNFFFFYVYWLPWARHCLPKKYVDLTFCRAALC